MKVSDVHPLNIAFFLFPLVVMLAIGFTLIQFVLSPGWLTLFLIPLVVYGLPLVSYRAIRLFFPLEEGKREFDLEKADPWFIAIRIQLIYLSFPVFEQILILIPTAFNLWLRMWGSRIGKGVHFPPRTEISDRTHLEIGDNVIFGHKVFLSAHIIEKRRDKNFLTLKRIRIMKDALIGGFSIVAPGVIIHEGVQVAYGTQFLPDEELKENNKHSRLEKVER